MREIKTRPAIFTTAMVAAIMDGRKTMTRRLLYSLRDIPGGRITPPNSFTEIDGHPHPSGIIALGQYWAPTGWHTVLAGDLVWVKETHYRWGRWYQDGKTDTGRPRFRFEAANDEVRFCEKPPEKSPRSSKRLGWFLRPSIFMPAELSRITLKVSAVKIEPLAKISEADAKAEGIFLPTHQSVWTHDRALTLIGREYENARSAEGAFRNLWEMIHGRESWDKNPAVVALAFKAIKRNHIKLLEAA